MKYFFLLVLVQLFSFVSEAQLPGQKTSNTEMQAQIEEMKKEIAQLEADLKKAEKDDPEEAAMLKTQLSAMKSMLAMFDKPKAAPKAQPAAPVKKVPVQQLSPIEPVVLKQPLVVPTTAQAKDRYFWYRGKKINDSTLVTTKGMVVQYKKKKLQLVIQPEKKTDSLFMMAAQEITKNEERKNALVKNIEGRKNGFTLYPHVNKAMTIYDDLVKRFASPVRNSFNFNPLPRPLAFSIDHEQVSAWAAHGPSQAEVVVDDFPDDRLKWVLQQLEEAKRKAKQLPPISDFPAPPRKDLGMCASCDKDLIRKQFVLDSIWIETYQGKETEIMQQVISAVHAYEIYGLEDSADYVNRTFKEMESQLLGRMLNKDKLLMERNGKNLEYLTVIAQVVLGHERQLQLLGLGEDGSFSSGAMDLLSGQFEIYNQYYKEQVGLRNHDFVLNLSFHLGMERQLQLLGNEGLGLSTLLEDYTSYNRFALTLEVDFSWEKKTSSGELDMKATGNMASGGKTYTMLMPDSCGFRMIPYQTIDLTKMVYTDVTISLQVKGGVKTIRDDQGKLKTIAYSGPASFNMNLPKSRIDFCNNRVPDTLFVSGFSGNEEVAALAAGGLEAIRTKYTVDMAAYANLVFYTESDTDPADEAMKVANDMMRSIGGAMQQSAPGDLMGKMKMQYEGFMHSEDQQKALQATISTQKATLLFNANNRSTVLADQYIDTKRKLDDDAELTRGMTHLRIVHEPLK